VARAKSWYTVRIGSNSTQETSILGDVTLTGPPIRDPTILRTRAHATLATSSFDLPPVTSNNPYAGTVIRLRVTPSDELPDFGWEFEPSGEDNAMHGVEWSTGLYIPANPDFGRPERTHSNGWPAGGMIDAHGGRHFAGLIDLSLSYYIGPAQGALSGAEPEFVAALWARVLVESTI